MGVGAAVNSINRTHRAFFDAGGLGRPIGDGRSVRCAPESAFEAFHAVSPTKAITVAVDDQRVGNPACNGQRRTAGFLASRLHVVS